VNQREELDLVRTANIANITVIGRRTGRSITLPVQFVHEENKILLLPFMGKKTGWYANLTKNPAIAIEIKGTKLKGNAELSTDGAMLARVVEKFKAKYGESNITDYYPTKDAFVEVVVA
jgi:deazaflavin-dependent oxidoreductase (nitroreductase family)